MQYNISIIIPILNESERIASLLKYLIDNSSKKNIAEIIIVDGGSTDGSQDIISSFILSRKSNVSLNAVENKIGLYRENHEIALDTKFSIENSTRTNISLLNYKRGRAKQMNHGASKATGSILYFLHADALPPKDYDYYIIQEVKKNHLAGCFRMQFDHDHWWLRLASWLTQFSWRACRGGDQSQFITKKLFNNIGGFDESYVIYEDNILISELYARDEFVVIQHKIKTSARCYNRNGIWKLQYHFWSIYVKKWLGASAENLYQYHKKHII